MTSFELAIFGFCFYKLGDPFCGCPYNKNCTSRGLYWAPWLLKLPFRPEKRLSAASPEKLALSCPPTPTRTTKFGPGGVASTISHYRPHTGDSIIWDRILPGSYHVSLTPKWYADHKLFEGSFCLQVDGSVERWTKRSLTESALFQHLWYWFWGSFKVHVHTCYTF